MLSFELIWQEGSDSCQTKGSVYWERAKHLK